MTTDFPTAPSAYGLSGPSATVTVEKSLHASHTEILTTPEIRFQGATRGFKYSIHICQSSIAAGVRRNFNGLLNIRSHSS